MRPCLCYPAVGLLVLSGYVEAVEIIPESVPVAECTIRQLIVDPRQYQPTHSPEDFFQPQEPTTLSPIMASGAVAPYTAILSPVVDEAGVAGVRLALNRHGTQKVVGRYFRSWAELRVELVRSKILRPQELAVAEFSILRGLQWVSPSPTPVTERQITLLKLRP